MIDLIKNGNSSRRKTAFHFKENKRRIKKRIKQLFDGIRIKKNKNS